MFLIFTLFLYVFILVIALSLTIFLVLSMRDSLIVDVPFIFTRKQAIEKIIQSLHLSSGSFLYDLGCGDGRILIASVKSCPGIFAIGIERGIIPFIVSKIRTIGFPIKILRQNIFDTNLSRATHIYMYLNPKVVNMLAPKIKNESKSGTRIISCDYKINDWVPIEEIPIPVKNNQLTRILYVYIV